MDVVHLRLFPFSLLGKAKQWFYVNHGPINTWSKCSEAFLKKFFSLGKTNALCGRISGFQQAASELFQRLRKGFKSMFLPVHTIGWRIGSFFIAFIMG
jgi:hypothetical protein